MHVLITGYLTNMHKAGLKQRNLCIHIYILLHIGYNIAGDYCKLESRDGRQVVRCSWAKKNILSGNNEDFKATWAYNREPVSYWALYVD